MFPELLTIDSILFKLSQEYLDLKLKLHSYFYTFSLCNLNMIYNQISFSCRGNLDWCALDRWSVAWGCCVWFFFRGYFLPFPSILYLQLLLPGFVPHILFQLIVNCVMLTFGWRLSMSTLIWFQAASVAVKQYIETTFSHLLHNVSGTSYGFNFLSARIWFI